MLFRLCITHLELNNHILADDKVQLAEIAAAVRDAALREDQALDEEDM